MCFHASKFKHVFFAAIPCLQVHVIPVETTNNKRRIPAVQSSRCSCCFCKRLLLVDAAWPRPFSSRVCSKQVTYLRAVLLSRLLLHSREVLGTTSTTDMSVVTNTACPWLNFANRCAGCSSRSKEGLQGLLPSSSRSQCSSLRAQEIDAAQEGVPANGCGQTRFPRRRTEAALRHWSSPRSCCARARSRPTSTRTPTRHNS